MTVEQVNAYFTPLDYVWYLGAVLVIMTIYSQWKWAKICVENVMVLVTKMNGDGDFILTPQTGGTVSIRNRNNGSISVWPINELSTSSVPYPGLGFIPKFLQKKIRLIVVNEANWEPVTNRGDDIIASPQFLGNLIHEKITGVIMTINKEVLDQLGVVMKKLSDMLNPTIVYIMLGLLIVLAGVNIYLVMPSAENLGELGQVLREIQLIKQSLGITVTP
jgi:hypothetical protein